MIDIFQNKWKKRYCDPATIVHQNFLEDFEHHFYDPLSQALMTTAKHSSKSQAKRSQFFRIGLLYLDKGWRLTNTHAESLSYDTMRCIMAKSNEATSFLTSSKTVQKAIDILKSRQLPAPDPKLAIVRSIDNYRKFKTSSLLSSCSEVTSETRIELRNRC